jgi:hypothetical protein
MPIIDVQAHPYERNYPGRPWAGDLQGPESASGDEIVEAMNEVGLDAAILVSSFNLGCGGQNNALFCSIPPDANHDSS